MERKKVSPEEQSAAQTYRHVRKDHIQHHDLQGLAGLMDDYMALSDELEEDVRPTRRKKSRRAA